LPHQDFFYLSPEKSRALNSPKNGQISNQLPSIGTKKMSRRLLTAATLKKLLHQTARTKSVLGFSKQNVKDEKKHDPKLLISLSFSFFSAKNGIKMNLFEAAGGKELFHEGKNY
jgi:hypothetical protein